VVVLARHSSRQPFEPVATVRTRGSHRITYRWKLDVQPETAATYIAEVTAQGLCYVASRCAHPQGQVWTNAKSRPFTVRIREEGASAAANTQRTIGLVGWDRSGELAGAQAAASALGDQLVVPGGHAKAAILSLIAQHAAAIVVGSDGLSDTDGSGLSPAIAQAHEAGIPTVSFTRRYPGSVWVRQSSDATPVAHALADALASQMKGRGQFVIVSCRHAEPAVATWLQRMKSYIGRRYPHMQLAGVAQRGVEIQPGVWARLTLGSVLRADPHLRGLIFMCGAAPTGELADAHKLGKVFSVGVDRSCPPLGFPDSYPIRSGATELICTADWTGLGYLTIWAADHLAAGSQFFSGSYDVGGPVGAVQFYDQSEELRLVVPPLTLTKANVTQYVTRP
jgi:rhamnose transport system substrate-binding protein